MKTKDLYIAPSVELVKLSISGIIMTSGIDDYNDNPIFGAPDMDDTIMDIDDVLFI